MEEHSIHTTVLPEINMGESIILYAVTLINLEYMMRSLSQASATS